MLGSDARPDRITDVAGVRVGHWTDLESATGCTVVLCDEPVVAGVAVRGGAPGTRETDLLAPGRLVESIDAILLTGGSAFGLAAADGVVRWLAARGRGFNARTVRVPIVPAAVIFDLGIGAANRWPGPDQGIAACDAASDDFLEGSVGAGTGSTVGKLFGNDRAMKGGIGTAALPLAGRWRVGALAVVNAFGDVVDPDSGTIIAGARGADAAPAHTVAKLLAGVRRKTEPGAVIAGNTTLVVVATDARLDRTQLSRLADIAHNGIALAVRPSHTLVDGDSVFALATGQTGDAPDPVVLGVAAVEVVTRAILRAVVRAESLYGIPSVRELGRWAY